MTTHSVTLNGHEFTRKSKHTYTHAVAVHGHRNAWWWDYKRRQKGWDGKDAVVLSWHRSAAAAATAAATAGSDGKGGGYVSPEVVPVLDKPAGLC